MGARRWEAIAGVVFVTREPDIAFTLALPGITVTQDKFDQIMALICLRRPVVDIIASWSPLSSPSTNPNDTRKVQYNIISGTSMVCPHASGAAAYVKSLHRDLSPAMIMSALITTEFSIISLNVSISHSDEHTGQLQHDSAQVRRWQLNPVKAQDPGLVYDASESDYVTMLPRRDTTPCSLCSSTGSNTTACSNASTSGAPSDLNYPTMAAHVEACKNFTVVFPWTATNVGAASAMYNVKVVYPIVRLPMTSLEFNTQNQKVSFSVTVTGMAMEDRKVHSAAIIRYNNEHEVRRPVVVYATSSDDSPASPSKMGFRQ
ncbi:hypothetical protein BDA96_02G066700 [Sorghum bicolor]|uniref:Peptidase S8/S53 domain-containing protein n=1 Tax=Sorghum bicolor TaxID=4558 RepID=A0A921RKK4_SORBI|nr:hypothetical protein BDA96_02G066700 [Sorghum bicolor]